MNSRIGWALAAIGAALGFYFFGWQGVALAATAMVFWLLLQFSQAMRAMRAATARPKGKVPSAVMLHAQLATGQRLMMVIQLARSLGDKLSDQPETYAWADDAGARVTVQFKDGLVTQWTLTRPDEPAAPEATTPSP